VIDSLWRHLVSLTAEDWSAFGAMITAAVAVVAALFARSQVREARRTREAQTQPFVIVDLQPSPDEIHVLNLIVENIGATIARDVAITFDPPLKSSMHDYEIADSPLLTEGIPTLPPGRRIEALFDISFLRLKTDLPMRYDATISFCDAFGRKQEPLQYIIDLHHLIGLEYNQKLGLQDIAKSLKEINSTMKAWSGSRGLHVWVRDEDAKLLRDAIETDLTGHSPSLARRRPPDYIMAIGRILPIRIIVRNIRKVVRKRRGGSQRS